MKICKSCNQAKPVSEYGRQAARKDGLYPWCKPCQRAYNRDWSRNRSPESRAKHLAWRRANEVQDRRGYLYGLTPERLAELVQAQGGRCAICGTGDPGGRWGEWHVDHDHTCCPRGRKTCGRCVRGLLCQGCNMMLGHAKDDPERLARAVEYLSKG